MNNEYERAISIATRASKLEGAEKWPWDMIDLDLKGKIKIISVNPPWRDSGSLGPWLCNDFTSPWSSSKFLERAGCVIEKGCFYLRGYKFFCIGYGIILSDIDLMEAIVTLGEYVKEKGGAYQEAWDKGMNLDIANNGN